MPPHRETPVATLTAVEAIPFLLPYRHAPAFASGRVSGADNVLVRVHTDGGLTGQAEAQPRPYTYGETQGSIVAAVREWLAPRLRGLDASDTGRAYEVCAGLSANNCARAAIDVALWDLRGQLAGESCWSVLGGSGDPVTVAYMLSLDEPAAMAAHAVEMHERHGIATFKVKVGRDPQVDVEATRRVREALPGAHLYVDANRGWSVTQALEAGEALIELGVRAIEEPIAIDDHAGRRRLAERWAVPLAGDESCISREAVERALAEGAVGQVAVKAARTGFTESARIVALCRTQRVPALAASQYEGAIGTLATLACAGAFPDLRARPVEAGNFLDLEADLCEVPPVIDGRLRVPDEPGLGIHVDEDRLTAHRVEV